VPSGGRRDPAFGVGFFAFFPAGGGRRTRGGREAGGNPSPLRRARRRRGVSVAVFPRLASRRVNRLSRNRPLPGVCLVSASFYLCFSILFLSFLANPAPASASLRAVELRGAEFRSVPAVRNDAVAPDPGSRPSNGAFRDGVVSGAARLSGPSPSLGVLRSCFHC